MRIPQIILILNCLLFLGENSKAQKSIEPLRINEKIDIDGLFEEDTWKKATIATDFIQSQPQPKEKASQKSEVQVAYDNDAIYVAARLYVEEGFPIYKELGQRDDLGVNAETFFVFFDTFDDDQNGFGFGVTSAGVQAEAKYSPNNEDFQWDAVWESKTRIDEKGWYVEMKIPYYNLRFAEKEVQNWGLNFLRNIREGREQTFWNFVDQNISGFVNQWGTLNNIKSIDPPLRLSFTPFVSTNIGTTTNTSTQTDFNAGMDVKYGIDESFTLDMTLIPDFGNVRSDEQILNLGPFEQVFDENRAFFTEGTELFGKNRLFYSRRIGQQPDNYYGVYDETNENEIVDQNPIRSKLINATKISGRTSNNVGLGFFNAVTNKSDAVILDTLTGETRGIQTAPLTNYNILVAEKALKNASTIHIINTNVNRVGNARDANVTGFGGQIRDKNNTFIIESATSISQVFTKDAYNLTRNKTGFTTSLEAYKTKGKLNYGAGANIESDEYDPNDLGLLFSNNETQQFAFMSYNQNDQTDWYRYLGLRANISRSALYKPNIETGYRMNVNGNIWLNNLTNIWGGIFYTPGNRDYFEPRTFDFETYLQRPERVFAEIGFSTDYAKQFAIDASIERGTGQDDIPINVWNYFISPRFRFSDKFNSNITYRLSNQNQNLGFAGYGNNEESLMGYRDRITNITELEGEYKFNENMNLSLFGRYTWDTVEYESFHTLEQDGSLNETNYAFENANNRPEDRNFSAFNLDAIFRWRFAPGSDIIAVYKKQLAQDENQLSDNYFRNLDQLFSQSQSDVLNLKLVYFIDYNTLRKDKS